MECPGPLLVAPFTPLWMRTAALMDSEWLHSATWLTRTMSSPEPCPSSPLRLLREAKIAWIDGEMPVRLSVAMVRVPAAPCCALSALMAAWTAEGMPCFEAC